MIIEDRGMTRRKWVDGVSDSVDNDKRNMGKKELTFEKENRLRKTRDEERRRNKKENLQTAEIQTRQRGNFWCWRFRGWDLRRGGYTFQLTRASTALTASIVVAAAIRDASRLQYHQSLRLRSHHSGRDVRLPAPPQNEPLNHYRDIWVDADVFTRYAGPPRWALASSAFPRHAVEIEFIIIILYFRMVILR